MQVNLEKHEIQILLLALIAWDYNDYSDKNRKIEMADYIEEQERILREQCEVREELRLKLKELLKKEDKKQ